MPVRGTVKWFSSEKGYGFITCEGRDEVFAHYSEIVDDGTGFRFLERGTEVEFELVEGERGPRARHIVKLKAPETEDQHET
ncbi:MAG: cold-shock protein [Planctomycetes bacterium SM23_65]|nr:MAG: cold-shock protein [Planctomycetes bacterium SM23_65]